MYIYIYFSLYIIIFVFLLSLHLLALHLLEVLPHGFVILFLLILCLLNPHSSPCLSLIHSLSRSLFIFLFLPSFFLDSFFFLDFWGGRKSRQNLEILKNLSWAQKLPHIKYLVICFSPFGLLSFVAVFSISASYFSCSLSPPQSNETSCSFGPAHNQPLRPPGSETHAISACVRAHCNMNAFLHATKKEAGCRSIICVTRC